MGSMKNWMLGAVVMAGAAAWEAFRHRLPNLEFTWACMIATTFLQALDRGTFGPPGTITGATGFQGGGRFAGYRGHDRIVGATTDRDHGWDRGHDRFRR